MAKKVTEKVEVNDLELGKPISEAYFHQAVPVKASGFDQLYAQHVIVGRADCRGVKLYLSDVGVTLTRGDVEYCVPFTNVRYYKVK
jgi:hypothetical protein